MEMGWSCMVMTIARTGPATGGFTLIEVMIALTIFTIGLLGISGMLLVGEKGITVGNKSLPAVQISKAQMEQLKGGSTLESGTGECSALSAPGIQCRWTIRGDTPAEDLYEIEVRASWHEGENIRELILSTLRYIK